MIRIVMPAISAADFPCPDDPPLPGAGATQKTLAEWLLRDEAADEACRASLAALKAALAARPADENGEGGR
ncbi:MAG: hypothetical protein GC199_07385 [Alphaproteobacteria bacterium]|nr:hypothetical protein [Alphaproteobacteria bacterium]